MPWNGYRNNPIEDVDIDYLKNLRNKYFPDMDNILVYTSNKHMTTEQVEKLCMNLIDRFWQGNTLSHLNDAELNKLINIAQRVQDAMTYEQTLRSTSSAKSAVQRSFLQSNYRRTAQQEKFTFLPDQEQSLSDEELADQIKLASQEENKRLYGGIHPVDAFIAQAEMNKLLNQQYRDYDIYGTQECHPLDAFRINNINNKSITPCYQQRRHLCV